MMIKKNKIIGLAILASVSFTSKVFAKCSDYTPEDCGNHKFCSMSPDGKTCGPKQRSYATSVVQS